MADYIKYQLEGRDVWFIFFRGPLEKFFEASILERQIYYDDKGMSRKGTNIKG